ncbi:class I SAM-dependent methyltransferase [Marinomonas colpomeniae]|uniref:Methyltransferase domain-containing protein n=1 Tax=Marinomonas colpomeniae TaxID=2774408 RepID=A0ABR8NZS7_9GAMM|nr:methyltransferase domain-containing protein [Marinomonas colpomeniae]MBD5771115.1 methyltransferase domain-containing protein [Marinomonas colpomeniae]
MKAIPLVKKIYHMYKKINRYGKIKSVNLHVEGINLGSGANWCEWFWQGIDSLDGEFLDETTVLPFKDGSLDAVYTSHFIEHVTDEVATHLFFEVYRVLKPGGIFRIVAPNFELFHQAILENDMSIFNEIGFKGRPEWEEAGVDSNVENLALHWFANYQTVPYLESELNGKQKDFYRGPPIIAREQVLNQANLLSTEDFGSWVVSHVPKDRLLSGGHISTWTHRKLNQFLEKSGFRKCNPSTFNCSKNNRMSKFDTMPNREKQSLYHEVVK